MKKNILLFILCVIFVKAHAQNTLSLCKDNVYNYFPASASEHFIGHFSLPGISNINVHFSTNLLHVGDILKLADQNLEPGIALLKNAKKYNHLGLNLNVELLGFGFRVNQGYVTFSQRLRTEIYMAIPGDLATITVNGNNQSIYGKEYNASLKLNLTVYNETSVGYQHKINDMFSVGGKLKFLTGHANVTTKSSDMYFKPIQDSVVNLGFRKDFTVLASGIEDIHNIGFPSARSLLSNHGAGIDLGLNVNLPFGLELRASVIDLGFIKWNKNNSYYGNIKPDPTFVGYKDGEITFQGIDYSLDQIFNNSGGIYDENNAPLYHHYPSFTEAFEDAVIIDTVHKAYTSITYPKIFVEAAYSLGNDKISNKFAVMARCDFVYKKAYPFLILGYNLNIRKVMDVALSYTLGNGYYKNLGLALSFNLGDVFHIYAATDNILSFATALHAYHVGYHREVDYYNVKYNYFNIQTGIYFTIPQKKRVVNTSIMRCDD